MREWFSCCLVLAKQRPSHSAHTALTVPQERGRARGTAIQRHILLPILTPKVEPFFMKGWLGRSRLGSPWIPIAGFTTLVSSASSRVQVRESCCLWLSVRKAVFLGLWSSLKA